MDALRLEIYPEEDISEEDSIEDEYGKGHRSSTTAEKDIIGATDSTGNRKNCRVLSGNSHHERADGTKTITTATSNIKPISRSIERVERRRPRCQSVYSQNVLPRQQQIEFDANQISPLLQQCLGKDGGYLSRRKQVLKRTEPVRHCRTGGRETYRPSLVSADLNDERWGSLTDQHRINMEELSERSQKVIHKHSLRVRNLERERQGMLRGGMVKTGKSAMDILNQLKGLSDIGESPRD